MARFHKNDPKHEKGVFCLNLSGQVPRREANEKTSRQRGSRPPPTFQRRETPRAGTVASSSPPGLVNQSIPIHGNDLAKAGPVSAGDTNPDSSHARHETRLGSEPCLIRRRKHPCWAGTQGDIVLVVLKRSPFPGLPKEASWFFLLRSFVRFFLEPPPRPGREIPGVEFLRLDS